MESTSLCFSDIDWGEDEAKTITRWKDILLNFRASTMC